MNRMIHCTLAVAVGLALMACNRSPTGPDTTAKPTTDAATAPATGTDMPAPGDALTTGAVELPFGSVNLKGGLPATPADTQKLFDQLDFQQASQAYLWALPIVAFAEWEHAHSDIFGAKPSDLVLYSSYTDRLGILTANATTPYIMSFTDMSKTGPMVIELPPGPTAGGLGDFWQREIAVIGEMGPDAGKGAKYLIVPPGTKPPSEAGYRVIQSSTVNLFLGIRALDPDAEKAMALVRQVKIYPFSERANPPETRLVSPEGKPWYGGQPRGLDYWKRLHAILQVEPVAERDRFYMAMLANLGIEKGKPFQPDERQQKILLQGALAGELMAKANTFDKRFAGAKHWPDRRWDYILVMPDPDQRIGNYDALLERAAYFYEAVTYSKAMTSKTPGEGQAYLAAYTDKDGQWLDGGENYTLHVPANPPAKLFWSVTVYDSDTRALIDNEQKRGDRSSRDQLKLNADGSVDLYYGPKPPASGEANWVQTIPGRPWYGYMRFYGPTEGYFDKSWKLPDIEKLK